MPTHIPATTLQGNQLQSPAGQVWAREEVLSGSVTVPLSQKHEAVTGRGFTGTGPLMPGFCQAVSGDLGRVHEPIPMLSGLQWAISGWGSR